MVKITDDFDRSTEDMIEFFKFVNSLSYTTGGTIFGGFGGGMIGHYAAQQLNNIELLVNAHEAIRRTVDVGLTGIGIVGLAYVGWHLGQLVYDHFVRRDIEGVVKDLDRIL